MRLANNTNVSRRRLNRQSFWARIFFSIDWIMLAAAAALVTISLFAVHSATFVHQNPVRFVGRQAAAAIAGVIAMIFFASFNYQFYKRLWAYIYGASIALLASVLIFGTVVNNARRWINFHFFSFQPVEVAKIMFIIAIAAYLDNKRKEMRNISTLFAATCILLGHFALIMLQPAFSSTLVYFPILIILFYANGADVFHLFCIITFGALALGIPLANTFFTLYAASGQTSGLMSFLISATSIPNGIYILIGIIILIILAWWFLKKLRLRIPAVYIVALIFTIIAGCIASVAVEGSIREYQRRRLIVFLNPGIDPLGSGFNTLQSKITLGSGGLLGRGFLNGTQTQLGFLPEHHTDYIFSVIGEEGGFAMSMLTLFLYAVFIWRAMLIAQNSRDRFGSLLAMGICVMFMFHAVINIGMVMGIMPTAGIPLLMVSYGGSSMFSSLCAIGILMSIQLRRYTH
ncbi:MAG: rod shape-determining protein RodA [Elusimicrobia bacterium]|nr:rod shape-determining protein RodA [Elusimicrobiota bacterium]